VGSGSQFNIGAGLLTKHNLVSFFPVLARVSEDIKVKNLFGIRSGQDYENDNNYRFRLSNKVVSAVTGNESAIRKAVLSVPGIVDMSLIPRTHGNGTFTIFPRSQEPILSDGLMDAVLASVESVKAIGSIAYVEAPEYLAASIRLELRFGTNADKNAIYGNARRVVMDYINNLDLGGEIVINEIIQLVMSIDNQIVDMMITSFGFGLYDRISGGISNYMPLRLLNQRADWKQKWYINSSLCTICEAGTV
jgi:uncharacterized phage protein gp47/JayE